MLIMNKIVIFGNSGSGKSTLAKMHSAKYGLSHLDLDTLAWLDVNPPERKPVGESQIIIKRFLDKNKRWVVEGCYTDLLSIVIKEADKVIFLNPGIEACIDNCKKRPWEPHKYKSIEEQNKNLDMLIKWVREYTTRSDEFSFYSHNKLFEKFSGEKEQYTSNYKIE